MPDRLKGWLAVLSGFAISGCSTDAGESAAAGAGTETRLQVHRQAPAANAFRVAVRTALPALVFVEVEDPPRSRVSPLPSEDRPSPPNVGSGSGFVLAPEGYILTNNHVVKDALTVTVVLSDNRRLEATVVGRDPNTDIAVLKVAAEGLPTARLGDSDSLQVGDWVLALGYPLGLSATVTAGIVSATARTLGILQEEVEATAPLEHFIQTDAAINPGNSGGPMVDLTGHVVGVNSAIVSPTGFYTGYGFAVPITLARRVAQDLIRVGEVRRPRLGIGIEDADPADAEVYSLPAVAGAEVVGLAANGPAAEAGVELGDVIVAADAEKVATVAHLEALVAGHQPGDVIRLQAIRYGRPLQFTITLGTLASPVRQLPPAPLRPGPVALGFVAGNGPQGVVVLEVERYSAALRAGVRPGQRILAVNRHLIRAMPDLEAAIRAIRPPSAVSIRVVDPKRGETIVNYLPSAGRP